jgi:hypothetical protein
MNESAVDVKLVRCVGPHPAGIALLRAGPPCKSGAPEYLVDGTEQRYEPGACGRVGFHPPPVQHYKTAHGGEVAAGISAFAFVVDQFYHAISGPSFSPTNAQLGR